MKIYNKAKAKARRNIPKWMKKLTREQALAYMIRTGAKLKAIQKLNDQLVDYILWLDDKEDKAEKK